MKIFDVRFGKAQRGWICDLSCHVTVHTQFSDMMHTVRGHSMPLVPFGPLGVLSAYLDAWRLMRVEIKRLQAEPGGHNNPLTS
jgi:hypothetical protein